MTGSQPIHIGSEMATGFLDGCLINTVFDLESIVPWYYTLCSIPTNVCLVALGLFFGQPFHSRISVSISACDLTSINNLQGVPCIYKKDRANC